MNHVIELRETSILFVAGKASRGKIATKKVFRIDLDIPLFLQGMLVFDDVLITKVKKVMKQNKFKPAKARVILNDRITLTRDITIPNVDKKKRQFVIANEMATLFNLSKNYVIDYRDLESYNIEPNQRRVIASAISTEVISRIEAFLKALKIRIESLETASSSFIRFNSAMNFVNSNDASIVVEVTDTYVRNYLFDHRSFTFLRSFYVQDDDTLEDVTRRIYQILDVIAQYNMGKTGRPVNHIVLLGLESRYPIIKYRYKNDDSVRVDVADVKDRITPHRDDILDYGNALGALL